MNERNRSESDASSEKPHPADDLAMALSELAASTSGHSNESIVPAGNRRCPICQQVMQAILQHGVSVDVCANHGVWLDQGEFASILEAAYWHRRDVEARPSLDRDQLRDNTAKVFRKCVQNVTAIVSRGM